MPGTRPNVTNLEFISYFLEVLVGVRLIYVPDETYALCIKYAVRANNFFKTFLLTIAPPKC